MSVVPWGTQNPSTFCGLFQISPGKVAARHGFSAGGLKGVYFKKCAVSGWDNKGIPVKHRGTNRRCTDGF